MSAHPDALLPKLELSLRQFNNLANNLHDNPDPTIESHQKVMDYIRVVLEGRYTENDEERRIYIDGMKGLTPGSVIPYGLVPEQNEYQISRDFDSVIGYSDTLPYAIPIAAYVVPPFNEGIRKDLHIKTDITTLAGDKFRVDIGAIPNMPFAKVGARGTCNIAFPALYGSTRRGVIARPLCVIFYEQVLRPVLLEVDLDHIGHWPPSYHAAEELKRGKNGQYHFGSVPLPVHCLEGVVRGMKAKMEEIPSFKGAFYIHDLRGVKGESIHNPGSAWERKNALNETCAYLAMTRVPRDQFFIDVGLEIRRPGHVVQWDGSAHAALLREVLPNTTPEQVDLLLGNHACLRDPNALLSDFAGLRIAPASRNIGDDVVYINIYTTDKTVHYQLHHGVFQKHKCEDLLPHRISHVMDDVDRWTKCLYDCMGGDDNHEEQVGAARCELRVPMSKYETVLLGMEEDVVNRVVAAIPARTWWKFKWNRAMACYYVLETLRYAPAVHRRWLESFALGAGIIYVMNSLFYTPDTGAAWQSLARHSAMRIPDDTDPTYNSQEEDVVEIPMQEIGDRQGLFFFGQLIRDRGTLRLSRFHLLPTKDLCTLYGEDSEFNLRSHFQTASIRREPAPKPVQRRFTNNASHTTRVTDSHMVPIPEIDFGLTARGVEFRRNGGISGPDAEVDSDDEDGDNDTMDQRVSKLWLQMLDDVLVGKGPNPRRHTQASYGSLSATDRHEVSEEMFKCFRLPFSVARYREASPSHWTLMFTRFFPEPGTTLPHAMQHFPACRYFQDYRAMISQMEKNDVKILRRALRQRWDGLYWMPYTGVDRMWVTRNVVGAQTFTLPPEWKGAAPQVGLNPRFARGAYHVELYVAEAED